MKYNLSLPFEVQQARDRLAYLIEKKNIVEIKKVNPNRSLNQNNYLHLLLGAFGVHFGYTLEEAKVIYKRDVNPDIYVYEKNNQKFMKSSADLDTEEMAKSIDRFHQYSREAGYPLPPATDQEWLRQIENEIERSKHYL